MYRTVQILSVVDIWRPPKTGGPERTALPPPGKPATDNTQPNKTKEKGKTLNRNEYFSFRNLSEQINRNLPKFKWKTVWYNFITNSYIFIIILNVT